MKFKEPAKGRTDEFERDDRKDLQNLAMHGVPLRFGVLLFDDPYLLQKAAKSLHGELRHMAICRIGPVVLSCVFANLEGRRRLISVRPASRTERRLYVAQMDD